MMTKEKEEEPHTWHKWWWSMYRNDQTGFLLLSWSVFLVIILDLWSRHKLKLWLQFNQKLLHLICWLEEKRRLTADVKLPRRPDTVGLTPPDKHKQSDKSWAQQFCLLVFEHSFISRRFSSLCVVHWAWCHQINETLRAAVPELKYTHALSLHHRPHCVSAVLFLCELINPQPTDADWQREEMFPVKQTSNVTPNDGLDSTLYDTIILFLEEESDTKPKTYPSISSLYRFYSNQQEEEKSFTVGQELLKS